MQGWIQWRRQCTLEGCVEDIRRELMMAAWNLFSRYVYRYLHLTNLQTVAPASMSPEAVWHLFESRQQLRTTRTGKRYKDWLFMRAGGDNPADAGYFKSGVALLIRDTTIDFLTREFPPPSTVSLQALTGRNPDGADWCFEPASPDGDVTSAVARRELDSMAGPEAEQVNGRLSHRERVALLARTCNRPLSDPDVLAVARCGKSQLCHAYRTALERTAETVKERHPFEDRDTLYQLTVETFRKLREMLVARALLDDSCRSWMDTTAGEHPTGIQEKNDHADKQTYVADGTDVARVAEANG